MPREATKGKITANRKMTDKDIQKVVEELIRWGNKERGTRLTWEVIERFSGFTKPALWAKPEIKHAYKAARDKLKDPSKPKGWARNDLVRQQADEIKRLRAELAAEREKWRKQEQIWHARWQRITYHALQKHTSIEELDRPMQDVNRS